MSKKNEWIGLLAGFFGAILSLYAVIYLNSLATRSLPSAPRAICIIAIYWIIAVVPVIVMLFSKDKLKDYGFCRDKIGLQVITGLILGIAMSLFLTLIPHLAGFGGFVDNGRRYKYIWQFIYDFCYYILSVGFVEEFVFRGFIYTKIERISQNSIIAVIVSSILFGVFHFLGGSVVQMIMTGCIGVFFCLCRAKIKNCSIISLIIAHGVYDALITVWAAVFLA